MISEKSSFSSKTFSSKVPDAVLCHFPQYKGEGFSEDAEGRKLIPIVAKSVEFFHYNTKHVRTIIPLSPCDAISIHKCQGQTCTGPTLMDLGGKEFSLGLFYVALSRVKELNRMAFDPMPDWQRASSFTKRVEFKERLEEEEKLDQYFKETLQKYRDSRKDQVVQEAQGAQVNHQENQEPQGAQVEPLDSQDAQEIPQIFQWSQEELENLPPWDPNEFD